MYPERIEDPAKWNLEDVAKIVNMLDFLKGNYKPFSLITKEAVRRGIIKEDERGRLFYSLQRVEKRVGLFEGIFTPADQSPTNQDRWEYRIPSNMTQEKFKQRLINYAKSNFKRAFNMDSFLVKPRMKTEDIRKWM